MLSISLIRTDSIFDGIPIPTLRLDTGFTRVWVQRLRGWRRALHWEISCGSHRSLSWPVTNPGNLVVRCTFMVRQTWHFALRGQSGEPVRSRPAQPGSDLSQYSDSQYDPFVTKFRGLPAHLRSCEKIQIPA